MSGTKYCEECKFWYWGRLRDHLIKYHKREIEKAKIEDNFDLCDYEKKDNHIKDTTSEN